MIQAPNLQNVYPAAFPANGCMCNSMMQTPKADYNAVKISIDGATVQAGGAGQAGYMTPTMPYYSYPQAEMYNYPQATQQPYYMPNMLPASQQYGMQQLPAPEMTANATANASANMSATNMPATNAVEMHAVPNGQCYICTPCAATVPTSVNADVAGTVVQPIPAPQVTPQVMQQNVNSPIVAPAPVISQQPTQDAKAEIVSQPQVEVKEPDELKPQVDINKFIASLTDPDFQKQAAAMESIAIMVNEDPKKAAELLDERVIKSLADIMNADTKELVGPSKEQIEVREKILANKEVTPEEKELANTETPREQAERNKSYALFTTAILEKLFADEVEKLSGQVVPFTELPGASAVVEQMKSNPNPTVRTSALEALSYVQRPEYKNDLAAIYAIAEKDQDKSVQTIAKAAIEKLNA